MIRATLQPSYIHTGKPSRDDEHKITLHDEASGKEIDLPFTNWYDASEVLISLGSNTEDMTTIDKTMEEA